MTEYALLTSVTVALIMLTAALYFDLRYQRIPNLLCLLTLILGIAVNSYFEGWDGLVVALSGAGLAIIMLIPVYYFHMLGAGDVKLMIGIGALAGPLVLTWSILYAIIFGVFTSIIIAAKTVGWLGLKNMVTRYIDCLFLGKYFKPGENDAGSVNVPYAPALMLGWMLASYINHDIYDLMWTVEVGLTELAASLNLT